MLISVICCILAVILLVAVAQYRARAGTYRSLSSRQPERRSDETPLGYEGLNMAEVDRTNRRNESLERGHTNWTRSGFGGASRATETDVAPLADDETYAARFHAAFLKDKSKD